MAYQTYLDQYDALYDASNWNELQRLWIHGIGGAQRAVVAHVAQEYCHPARPFDPVPDFQAKPFPRQLKGDKGDWFSASYNGGGLGGKLGEAGRVSGFSWVRAHGMPGPLCAPALVEGVVLCSEVWCGRPRCSD